MLLLILVIASILRLVMLNQSLWLDEAINVNNAASLDFHSLILKYSLGDFHPPLYHLILKSWISLFGSSEIAVRLPSVIFGIATVFMAYLIGKKLFEKKTAIISAILLATSPLHIYYSQEARMYALAAFFASLTVYFFISLLRKENMLRWLGFVASFTLLLYIDYLPYFLIPTFITYLFFNRKKVSQSTLKAFIPAFLLIFILLAPWLLIFPKQIQVGLLAASVSPAWAQVVGSPELKNLALIFVKFVIGRISHDNNVIYALLFAPLAIFITFLFAISLFRMSHMRSFLWFWLFGPILMAFILAFYIPIFSYFRFLFVLPAFYLILSSGVYTLNWIFLTRTLLLIFLLINLISTSIYFLHPEFQRENWRQATNFIHQNATPQTVVLFESDYPAAPFDYYNKGKIAAFGALSGFNADVQFVKQNINNLTVGRDKVFLFQYLSPITDPSGIVSQNLFDQGFINTSVKDFSGVGFLYEFKKLK